LLLCKHSVSSLARHHVRAHGLPGTIRILLRNGGQDLTMLCMNLFEIGAVIGFG